VGHEKEEKTLRLTTTNLEYLRYVFLRHCIVWVKANVELWINASNFSLTTPYISSNMTVVTFKSPTAKEVAYIQGSSQNTEC